MPITEVQLLEFTKWLEKQPSITTNICVEVINVTDNTTTYYKSTAEAAKYIGCDIGSISNTRTKPLHNKYLFKYITINEYIQKLRKLPFSFITK